jgi:hypothetical protein
MPSPSCNLHSVPAGADLTELLAQFRLESDGRSPPRRPPWQEWHHRYQLTSRPRPRCDNMASASNTRLTDRITRQVRRHDPNVVRETHVRVDMMMFTGTPPCSCITSPPHTPLAMRQPNFALPREAGRRPQAVARRCHST